MPDFFRDHGGKAVVIVLVVVNVVLIVMLVIRQHDLRDTATALPAAGSPSDTATGAEASGESASRSGGASDGASSEETPAGGAGDERRLLAANSERVAWRTLAGGCDTAATVEVTTDGGRTWKATNPGIRSIVRLKAFGSGGVFAIGADQDCKPTYAWVEGPNKKWQEDASQTADKWYRVPGQARLIHDAEGNASSPCNGAVADLAGIGTYQAAVTCEDGRIRTRDQATGWHTVERDSGAVALNADNSRFVVALNSDSCADGLEIRTFGVDGTGLSGDGGECRRAAKRDASKVAVSNIYTLTWLWSGGKVTVSP